MANTPPLTLVCIDRAIRSYIDAVSPDPWLCFDTESASPRDVLSVPFTNTCTLAHVIERILIALVVFREPRITHLRVSDAQVRVHITHSSDLDARVSPRTPRPSGWAEYAIRDAYTRLNRSFALLD